MSQFYVRLQTSGANYKCNTYRSNTSCKVYYPNGNSLTLILLRHLIVKSIFCKKRIILNDVYFSFGIINNTRLLIA